LTSPYSPFIEGMEVYYTAVVLLMLISYIKTMFVLTACLQGIYCAISLSLIQNVTLTIFRVYVLEKSVKSEITMCRVKISWEKWATKGT
jgi:hypothetical protein